MICPPYLLPLLNISLFSGLLVCQLVGEQVLNLWMFAICVVGVVGNLGWFFVSLLDKSPEGINQSDLRSEDKSAIMSDLDKEIERRREIEKVEKN